MHGLQASTVAAAVVISIYSQHTERLRLSFCTYSQVVADKEVWIPRAWVSGLPGPPVG